MKRDVQDRIWPLMGYADLKTTNDPKASSYGARKYELGGQRSVPGFMAMAEAMDFHEAIGKKNVEARVRQLSTKLRAGLKTIPGVKMWTSEDPQFAAGLTLFSVRDIPMENVRQGHLRLQPGVDPHDVDRQPERRARGDAHLQHAAGSRSPARSRDARRRQCLALHDDDSGRG